MIAEQEIAARTLCVPVGVELAAAGRQPVAFGAPLPRGEFFVRAAEWGRLGHTDGASVPVQVTPLCWWGDGSVRWVLAEGDLPEDASAGEWSLEIGGEGAAETEESIAVRESRAGWVAETGGAEFEIDRARLRPLGRVRVVGRTIIEPDACRVVLTDRRGRRQEAECGGWRVESAGPLRCTLVGEGRFRRVRGLRLRLRLSFFAGMGLAKLEITLHNPHRARHRGGIWDLGDAGSVFFRDLSLEISLAGGASEVCYSLDGGETASVAKRLSLYQDSSGGANWNSRNHVNRDGRVPCRFRGYKCETDGGDSTGLRAEPVVNLRSEAGSVSLAAPEFWQQFPKAISVEEGALRVGLFPREFDDLQELQGGERKTHTLWLQFTGADADPGDLAWTHRPAVVRPSVAWCDATGALPTLEAGVSRALGCLETLLGESLEGPGSIFANRESVDEYGWRNYGDIFADHEQAYYAGAEQPLISHYNNQFDMLEGFLLQFLRTQDRRWFELADALARHVMDIDIYHTRDDRAVYNGGLFWFTDHYLHAHTSTHRTYTRANRPAAGGYGGGPGAEHNFTTGLLHYHLLTGNPDAREAVLGLAEWVIAMEDGSRTVFGVVDDGPTGKATGGYAKPGRGGANSINALVDAWTLTRDARYLEFAEGLIRRCVHSRDDVDRLELLDVERNWSYTMFLSSVAKYLEAKVEAEQFDAMYAYGRASLLHYARWMLAHERPYFDQEEKLEYPTEAWAAQELRKANVFRLAARHAEEPLCSELLRKGDEFGDRAWHDLMRFEGTRCYARALALVMTEGLSDCAYRQASPSPARGV